MNAFVDGAGACDSVKIDVLATYWGTNGVQYVEVPVGWILMLHVTNPAYPSGSGTPLNTTHSRPNPDGSGTIYYTSGVRIADLHPGPAGGCAWSGAHLHFEVYNNHAWGREYEWHSSQGPDSYADLWGISDHIHDGTGYNHGVRRDVVSSGDEILGHLGGGTTMFFMQGNPYYGDHGAPPGER